MSGECQVNIKSLSELDIGGRETCFFIYSLGRGGVQGQIRRLEIVNYGSRPIWKMTLNRRVF